MPGFPSRLPKSCGFDFVSLRDVQTYLNFCVVSVVFSRCFVFICLCLVSLGFLDLLSVFSGFPQVSLGAPLVIVLLVFICCFLIFLASLVSVSLYQFFSCLSLPQVFQLLFPRFSQFPVVCSSCFVTCLHCF